MSSTEFQFVSLSDEDKQLFDSYKESINTQIHEACPSIPADYDLKPISVHRQLGCGTFYTYKVAIPQDQMVEVAFHLGGKRATPLVGPPHIKITKCN